MTLIPTKKMLHKNTKTENNVTYLTDVQILSQNSFSFCRLQIKLLDTHQGTLLFPPICEPYFFPQFGILLDNFR